MKKLLILSMLCLTCVLTTKAQSDVKKTGFNSEEIITSDQSKSKLWINLKKWISSSFVSYQHVVDMEDKDAGVLIIKWKSGLEYPASTNWSAQYDATYQIDIRENKYRVKVYNANAHVEPDLTTVSSKSIQELNVAQREIELVQDISNALQRSQNWSLDNKYLEVMEKENRFTIVMNAVKEGYENFNKMLLDSLKVAMSLKDDF